MAQTDYKATGNIQSFRGLLADGGQDKIRIQGSVGAIAWRITKFEIMANVYDVMDEYSVSIYREEQTAITKTFDFTEDELLAAAYFENQNVSRSGDKMVIFDNALFVRNIYISLKSDNGNSCNYYIELEEVKVSKASMAQLAVAAARRDPSLS